MDIINVLEKVKNEYETSIKTAKFNNSSYDNGLKAKEALIRSQRIINYIHEFIKEDFKKAGIPEQFIYPPIGSSNPEIKLKGFLKSKNQDIAIIPTSEIVEQAGTATADVERIISVNIRSQLSSLGKNIDTLYERTFAEALNLHLSYPKQCLGEVYLIPTHEYNEKSMIRNQVVFGNTSKIENYIRMFQAINNRGSDKRDEYKYERVCLLIVDFRHKIPKLYSSINELVRDGLISEKTEETLDNLTIDKFSNDIVNIYKSRFNNIPF